jgi:signal transduction histidine kinase
VRTGRDWAVDITAFLFAAAFGIGFALLRGDDPHVAGWVLVADQVTGGLACAAIWLRRRWPFEVAVLLLAVTSFSETAGGASVVALLAVAIRGTIRQAIVATAVGAASSVVFELLRPDPDVSFAFVVVFSTLITVALLGWGLFLRQRRALLAELRERAERAEAEAQLRAEHAQSQAREQIAREMHDVLGHRLSLLSVQAGALEYRRDASPAEVAGAAAVIRASAHQALEDLREVIGVLRAEVSELPQPTLADLEDLISESRRAGMRVALRSEVSADTLPERLGRTAYRIVQEGLTNARKHAPDAEVSVRLSGTAGHGLTVELANPVLSTSVSMPGAGQGLIGLAERAMLAGGYLAGQRAGSGEWRLWAWLPWPA